MTAARYSLAAGMLALASCAHRPPAPSPAVLELAASRDAAISIDASDLPEGVTEEERQAVNIFLGGAIEEGDASGYGIGLDYEHPLTGRLGIGFFLEHVDGIERSLAAGGQLYWRTFKELVLVFGLGGERNDDEWTPIARFGVAYEFPFGDGYFVAPGVFYDIGENVDVIVYGLDIGYAW